MALLKKSNYNGFFWHLESKIVYMDWPDVVSGKLGWVVLGVQVSCFQCFVVVYMCCIVYCVL